MSNRIERASSRLQKTLQHIITNQMNDPRINSFVAVSNVKVTPDFRFAKVKIALTDGKYENAEEVIKVLRRSEGFIKNKLSQMLDMPYIPKLDFEFDKNMQNALRVEELLNSLEIPLEEDDDESNN